VARSWPLGVAPGRTAPYPAEPDSATRRSRGAFDGLGYEDAGHVAMRIINAIMDWGWFDIRAVNALRQLAANVGCGSDLARWHDRGKVSDALTIAADELQAAVAADPDDVARRRADADAQPKIPHNWGGRPW
jgi:hypothetical protein